MKPRNIKKLLKKTLKENMPVLLKGAPGIGKTDIITQVVDELGYDLLVMHPVISDPTDFKGIPYANDGIAQFLPYGELQRIINASSLLVVLIDDIGQSPPVVQAACMQLLLARRIGEHLVSEHVRFIAATNRKQDRAGVSGILEPVKSRFVTIIELETDSKDWINWAIENKLDPMLIAFINFAPHLLHDPKPTMDIVNSPCPRTIAHVGKLLTLDLPVEVLREAVAGAAGEGFAVEFFAFKDMFEKLPDLHQVLNYPETVDVPNDPGVLNSLVYALASKIDKSNFGKIIAWFEKAAPDFATLFVKVATKYNPAVMETDAYTKWALKMAENI